MAASNYAAGLAFVWQPQNDAPEQGYHITSNDPGKGTYGGVIEATWAAAVKRGLVTGLLRNATREQLGTVLRIEFWGPACDALPSGLDLLLFNGRMMTGAYTHLFQYCLGLIGDDADGDIGPETLKVAAGVDPITFVNAMTGTHYHYLSGLDTWAGFGHGWTTRLQAAQVAAVKLIKSSTAAV